MFLVLRRTMMAIKFKRIEQVLTKKAYKDFCKFMDGQTVSIEGVYEDDFLRWIQKLPVID